jgi:hypothetical protein
MPATLVGDDDRQHVAADGLGLTGRVVARGSMVGVGDRSMDAAEWRAGVGGPSLVGRLW